MAEHGRGAWNARGAGGTKAYKSDKPGPYYYLGTGELDPDASQDNFAVRPAVKAYQRALNRRLNLDLKVDGIFGPATVSAVTQFQSKHTDELTVWGGIGPDTSRILLMPDLEKEITGHPKITANVVSGLVRHESGWDAGAVGYVDNKDLGLAQINGPSHPELSAKERLHPKIAFAFIVNYLSNALERFKNNTGDDTAFQKFGVLGDAVASYNLGIGGALDWISQGRPRLYTPKGASAARDVWAYINTVLEG
jgi:hypothetical protein